MSPGNIESLSERLGQLERANRRWRRGAGLVILAAVVAVGSAARFAGPAPELEAKRIILRDDAGTIRGIFGIRPDGTVGIDLNDAREIKRIGISVLSDGKAGIGLRDRNDHQVAEMYYDDGPEGAGFVVHDGTNIRHVGFGIREDGQAGFTIGEGASGGQGKNLAGMVAIPDGTTLLDLRSAAHPGHYRLRIRPDTGPEILVRGKDGKVLFQDP